MTDQIKPPHRRRPARAAPSDDQKSRDDWRAQFGRLLDDYRNHYVLPPRPDEKPRA
jgi:hypothetical protein